VISDLYKRNLKDFLNF